MIYADVLELYMWGLVNEERTSRGLNALKLETNLNASAEAHSKWMLEQNVFSHTGVGGSSSNDRIVAAGFDYQGTRGTAENIAVQSARGAEGFSDDVANLHQLLMESPGHRANVLNPALEYIGIGIEIGTYTYSPTFTAESVMITQNFGKTQGTPDLDDLRMLLNSPGAQVSGVLLQGDNFSNMLTGTDANDTLIGNGGADTLDGGDGNDLLIGGGPDVLSSTVGNDTFIGGAGRDAVSYQGSFGSLRVDLQFSHINTFAAAGDTYDSIEDVIGSQGADNIRGNQEDNAIYGGRNADFIFGRRGDDTLEGGVGDDVLFGGVGEDVLRGGENRDRAQYSEALEAVVLDLRDTDRNTGEAAGDVYDSIEDLAGSRYDDDISGDADSNRLFGRGGNDRLDGREGDDYLNGGGGQDTLIGGEGDDVLRGGTSRDTFVFDSGNDVIEDWFLDQINLDRDLWGGANLSAADIISDYGSVISTDTLFDFGSGNMLTIQGQTDIAALEAYIFDF